jgi:hypothetical protein
MAGHPPLNLFKSRETKACRNLSVYSRLCLDSAFVLCAQPLHFHTHTHGLKPQTSPTAIVAMPFEKRRPQMPKSCKASPIPDTEDEEPPLADATNAATPNPKTSTPNRTNRADLLNIDVTNPPIARDQKGKKRQGQHHCPQKDAANSHPFSQRCIKQNHCGYCPSCNHIVAYVYGCGVHRWKGEDLAKGEVERSALRWGKGEEGVGEGNGEGEN